MTRKKITKFIKKFRNDIGNNKSEWGNQTLEDFLKPMERYTENIQGCCEYFEMFFCYE